MEMKFLFAGAMFLGGWLWFYLFVRQFLFNILTAYPLIKKMRSLHEELIAIGARRYTTVSLSVCTVIMLAVLAVVIHFCKMYLALSFAGGALIAFFMMVTKLTPKNHPMFDTFCSGYYRFVPDDELRTAMYNKKLGQMKSRLKAMGIEGTFIPEFKDK